MCTAPRASPAAPCQPRICRWMGWGRRAAPREHERRCVNTACVHAEPLAWCWHSQEQNHCSLSKSWKGRKKRKGHGCQGRRRRPRLQAGSSPQFQHLFQCSGRSSREEREQRLSATLCARSPLHPGNAIPFLHPRTSRKLRLIYSSPDGQSFPQTLPCSLDNCKPPGSWS